MKSFKEIISDSFFNHPLPHASVSLKYKNHELFLRLDSKDKIIDASYTGEKSPWYASLCELLIGKSLGEALDFNWSIWEETFKTDSTFWEYQGEESQKLFFEALELLHATLDKFRGRDYLYHEKSPLICRCFGVREDDVLQYLAKEENPTVEGLGVNTKAGMGCRSCVPQLNHWFKVQKTSRSRFYKDRPVADWLIEIDEVLKRFPEASEWKMEVESFQNNQVIISFDKKVSQREEEKVARELQLFLSEGVDSDLGFFLRRA